MAPDGFATKTKIAEVAPMGKATTLIDAAKIVVHALAVLDVSSTKQATPNDW